MTDPIEILKQAQELKDRQVRFWYHDELPKLITLGIDKKAHIRANRICFYMHKHNIPVYRPWLEQLLRWQRVKGGAIKTPVMALKYQLLCDACKHGLQWTPHIDAHAERLAAEAVEAHKEKTRRG